MRGVRMGAGATSPLFRSEAVEARQQRVFGEIVLTQPVTTHILLILLFGIISLLALWVSLGTYTRTEAARGILVTDDASAKVIAVRRGIVTQLPVREGQFVRAGQTIATIRTEQSTETGGSAVADSLGALETQRNLTVDQVRLAGS
jgi:membrane fusion protein